MDDQERAAARRDEARFDAALVERARGDDPEAFGELYQRWFDRVHDLAFRITHDSSTAADIAQDSFVAAWSGIGKLRDPEAFGGWLLRITRNAAFNRRRKDERSSPRDTEGMAVIESVQGPLAGAPAGFRVEERTAQADDPARAAEDDEISALVWESAEALGERDAEVLDLTLRHGLTPAEVGEVIGINRNAANQTVHRVRDRLKHAVQARVLWRSGEPVCGDLADELAADGVTRFGSDAVRVATSHAETCEQCQRRRETKLEPSALFAATPFLVAPLLKDKIAHALSEQGVPVGNATSADGEAPVRKAWRARVLAGVVVVVLAVIAVVALAERLDHGTVERRIELAERATTTTAVPVTTVPPTVAAAPATTVPPRVTPPPLPPPPAPSGSISLSPSSSGLATFPRPTLSWTTANVAAVEVTGPNFVSGQYSGSFSVCPGAPSGPGCSAAPGSYTYTLRARDENNNLVLERSATFVVG